MSKTVKLNKTSAQVATLSIDNGKIGNALDAACVDELHTAFDHVANDPQFAGVRCLLLTGTGRFFCSGVYLDPKLAQDPNFTLEQNVASDRVFGLIDRIRSCRIPVICVLNGQAAGAGVSLMLACDFVIAANSARIKLAFIDRGLAPDLGATKALTELLSRAGAAWFLLAKDSCSAKEAFELGIVQHVAADEDLQAVSNTIADRISGKPPLAVAATRQLLSNADSTPLDDQMLAEKEIQDRLGQSSDFRESVASFIEKRAPNFTGE